MIDGVLAAARRLRGFLPEIVGPDAPELDLAIAQALNSADTDVDKAARLRTTLESRVETRMFLDAVLDDEPDFRPPQWRSDSCVTRRGGPLPGEGYAGLAGQPGGVPADLFVCQHGDYEWRRPWVGVPIRTCPTHRETLVPL